MIMMTPWRWPQWQPQRWRQDHDDGLGDKLHDSLEDDVDDHDDGLGDDLDNSLKDVDDGHKDDIDDPDDSSKNLTVDNGLEEIPNGLDDDPDDYGGGEWPTGGYNKILLS